LNQPTARVSNYKIGAVAWICASLLSEDHPRTPIAAFGVTIV
jgi:hypothetical protein